MRETKFRFWDIIAKKMISWEEAIANGWDLKLLENRYRMEYIGSKDKNGKEIYSGDILKHEYMVSPEMSSKWQHYEEVFEVKIPDFFLKIGEQLTHSSETLEEFVGHMEILGNIYENPELLK